MFPEVGEKLGPYEILGVLGGGGMARVYRARDERLHREVAIKLIDERSAVPGVREGFLREGRPAPGLHHPNICNIFDIGEQNGLAYVVMELLEGEPLAERMSRGAISVEEILRYSSEIADALAAAHARGIMHRDLTPTNILLVKKPNGSAQVKVLNFGPAGAGKTGKAEEFGQPANRGWDVAPQLAGMGATSGTVSYMSPEQARGEQLDARSDLFSLGAVMYEMATGKLPFRGNTSALVFVQLLGQMTPDPVRSLNLRIPAPLEQVIMKLLAKNPRARFQSATELIDELQDLAEQRSGWLARVKTRMLAASTANDGSATPGRTSIAGRPRMSFPAAAPYAGRFGLHRAGGAADECAEESARESGKASEEIGTGTKRGFAGLRPVVRGPAVPGAEKTEPSRQEATAAGRTRHPWWWAALVIALALALFILLGGLVA